MTTILASFWFWDRPDWGWAEVWALVILFVPSFALSINGRRFFLGLITGADNRWSTSKTSVVLWTYGLLFAFVTILLHTRGDGLNDLELSDQYLLLLGIPTGAAVGAQAITQSKMQQDPTYKTPASAPPNTLQGIGQLVRDEAGNADLLYGQYFLFNLLLLGYFITQFLSAESTTLPNLPDTLVGLTGVSATGYVAKKGVKNTA